MQHVLPRQARRTVHGPAAGANPTRVNWVGGDRHWGLAALASARIC